jgi:GH18 family chitinase
MRVAYFEAWNSNRKCLNMDVDQIDKSKYTHIHFAFANVTSGYNIDVSGAQHQFNLFKAMTGIKKIISFGGWDFSTKPGTFNILRDAVKPANRATFTSNIAAFIKKHNLDGVDIDWEYPGVSEHSISHALKSFAVAQHKDLCFMLINIEGARHS